MGESCKLLGVGDASVIHNGGGSTNVGAIKATSVSDLAFVGSSVIIASLIEETKGEVTSVNKMKKNEEKDY